MYSISVIICTFNPDKEIFSRCLEAFQSMEVSNINFEIIVIDNNSNNNFKSESYFLNFLKLNYTVKVFLEEQQGLLHSRIRGYRESKYDTILFFDDDNLPHRFYLKCVVDFFSKHDKVGILGPGIIKVEFPQGGDLLVRKYLRGYFQERYINEDKTSTEIWEYFYPPGSGIVVRRTVFDSFYKLFQHGKINCIGRKGDELSSGEDSQLIWSAVKMGYMVAVSSSLQITHLINRRRANINYLFKLQFNISKSFYAGRHEFFPWESQFKIFNTLTIFKVLFRSLIKSKFNIKLALIYFRLEIAWLCGHKAFVDSLPSN